MSLLTHDLPGREATRRATKRRRVPVLAMTVDETAEALGLSARVVADLLRDGELPGVRVGTRWIVPVTAVRDRLAELAAAGEGVRR